MKTILIIATVAPALLAAACGGGVESNSNSVNANATSATIQTVDANNLPPGLSASPVVPSGNSTPGIPAVANANVPRGATPTPGIPDAKNARVVLKPGGTPIPGIDPERVRRQMQQQTNGANGNPVPPPPPDAGEPMMRKKVNRPANSQ
jgi:ABC-type Fe3+-hydroxamate transport system substrate-binding protein